MNTEKGNTEIKLISKLLPLFLLKMNFKEKGDIGFAVCPSVRQFGKLIFCTLLVMLRGIDIIFCIHINHDEIQIKFELLLRSDDFFENYGP